MYNMKRKKALVLSGGGARGAFHVGVWKYLTERKWIPDIVCGTSVGAINAAAICCGLDLKSMEDIWRNIARKNVYRFPPLASLYSFFKSSRNSLSMLDTSPLENYMAKILDMEAVRKSKKKLFIPAVNISTAEVEFFGNKYLELDHILASSAIPVLFPPKKIGKNYYWDGGVMANTPIMPAIENGANDIIMVLPSPIGGNAMELPENPEQALQYVFEQTMVASSKMYLASLAFRKPKKDFKIFTVTPEKLLGFQSMMTFEGKHTDILVEEGYIRAKKALDSYLTVPKKKANTASEKTKRNSSGKKRLS